MDQWFEEYSYHSQMASKFKIKSTLHEEQSPWQKIEVLDTHAIGKLLLLDGKTMVSEVDEFVYHEIMGHVPNMIMPKAKKALIIGGGDCGIIREMVKHKNLEKIDLVEIDERVVEVSKKFFPQCTTGITDPRVSLKFEDGVKFIAENKGVYDIIIIDSTDPVGFAEGLFSEKFYAQVYEALSEDGIMMNQTENPFFDEFDLSAIYKNLKKSFPIVSAFSAPMIIYPGVFWTFGFASKKYHPDQINEKKATEMKELQKSLKWYNMDWHQGACKLPNLAKKVFGLE